MRMFTSWCQSCTIQKASIFMNTSTVCMNSVSIMRFFSNFLTSGLWRLLENTFSKTQKTVRFAQNLNLQVWLSHQFLPKIICTYAFLFLFEKASSQNDCLNIKAVDYLLDGGSLHSHSLFQRHVHSLRQLAQSAINFLLQPLFQDLY